MAENHRLAAYTPLELPLISYDTLVRAMRAIDAAQDIVRMTGADQFSVTFQRSDGTLAGKIIFDPNGDSDIGTDFMIDFRLYGQSVSRRENNGV